MKKTIFYLAAFIIFSSFTLHNDTNPELDGIWVHQEDNKTGSKTYLIVEGDRIQLYLEAYWEAGYNQYFSGDKLIANGSLLIHVDDYLTISSNTGQAIKYRNCQKFKLQRLVMHNLSDEQIKLEIVPGSSLYESMGFFQDKIMEFKKVTKQEFKINDPIFEKIPTLLTSSKTLIKDCSSIRK